MIYTYVYFFLVVIVVVFGTAVFRQARNKSVQLEQMLPITSNKRKNKARMWIKLILRGDIPFVWLPSEERFELLGSLLPPIPGALLIRQSL